MKMRSVVNDAVLIFDLIYEKFQKNNGNYPNIWNKQLFIISIALSIQEYIIKQGLSISEIENILFSGFIIDVGDGNVRIDGYSGNKEKAVIFEIFLKIFLVWSFEIDSEECRTKYLWIMLLYPFLAILEKLDPKGYKSVFKSYLKDQNFFDFDNNQQLWKQEECEETVYYYMGKYRILANAHEMQIFMELLGKGYMLRKVWLEKTTDED